MNGTREIHALLALAGIDTPVAECRDLGGGCIHRVVRVRLEDGRSFALKLNSADCLGAFREEAAGLDALHRTGTVLVPAAIHVGVEGDSAALLMSWIEPAAATKAAWRSLGEDLARLHQADAGSRYGFGIDNHLGMTPQPNTWCEDWVQFNRRHRFGHQLRLARGSGLLHAGEIERIERFIDRLDEVLPGKPRPALLHGDLWSGNALPTTDETGVTRIAVIDPAPSIGDGWADIAMMKLFGGFSDACFEAYAASVDDHDDVDRRIAAYQLYHVLNHVNLFGRGYATQAMSLLSRL